MKSNPATHQDYAIVLAWPDTTARGDHTWCQVLKKVGVLKNQNFKVGHAAVLLVNHADGRVHYFDFGRYVTPRGYGRARSVDTDPLLAFYTIADVNPGNKTVPIGNIEDILIELESRKSTTHGNGPLYASISTDIDFRLAYTCAMDFVRRGSMVYSAFMPGNSNCSRFVESVLISGLRSGTLQRRKLIVHETIVSSPISNVVNASCNGHVYIVEDHEVRMKPMKRSESRAFFVDQTLSNFKRTAAVDLPSDERAGFSDEPLRPECVPSDAQWLGGIGEGAWFQIIQCSDGQKLTKFDLGGMPEFERWLAPNQINWNNPYQITYDTHALKVTVLQQNNRVIIPLLAQISEDGRILDRRNEPNTLTTHELQYT
jgi:hypothetical protein